MSDWVIVEGTHEAIVSAEDWQRAYDMSETLGRVRSNKDGVTDVFSGLLRCPDCEHSMSLSATHYTVKKTVERKRRSSYDCATHRTYGNTACQSHYIGTDDLKKIVVADIQDKAEFIVADEKTARQHFIERKERSHNSALKSEKAALKKVQKRMGEVDKLLTAAFEKSVLGGESAVTFTRLATGYEAEKRELSARIAATEQSIAQKAQTEKDVDTFIGLMREYATITELDRTMAVTLIDHITISRRIKGEPQVIEIFYNLMGRIER